MSDQAVREIQLSGKQLFFLFMSSVVVAVVIFLLGVSVGRGTHIAVPAAAAGLTETPPFVDQDAASASTNVPPGGAPVPSLGRLGGAAVPQAPSLGGGSGGRQTTANAKPAVSASEQTARQTAPADPPGSTSTEASSKGGTPSSPAAAGASGAAPGRASTGATKSSVKAVDSSGWILQMGAFRSRDFADGLVAQLKAKGYQPFVTESGPLFLVRIGPFAERTAADAMATRLTKDGYQPLPVKR